MKPIHEPALISLSKAHLLAGFCASSYVGILYALQQTRITYTSESAEGQAKERAKRRDDPDVIRARLAAVTISTLVSCAVVAGTIWHESGGKEVCFTCLLSRLEGLTINLPRPFHPLLV